MQVSGNKDLSWLSNAFPDHTINTSNAKPGTTPLTGPQRSFALLRSLEGFFGENSRKAAESLAQTNPTGI